MSAIDFAVGFLASFGTVMGTAAFINSILNRVRIEELAEAHDAGHEVEA